MVLIHKKWCSKKCFFVTALDFENIQKSHEKNIEGDKILIVLTVTKVYLNSGLNDICLEKFVHLTF